MKSMIFLVAACLFGMSLPAQKTVINDPNVQLRDVKGFHAVDVANGIDIYISQGDKETVAVSARDTKWRDRIRTEVVDGVLKIRFDKDDWTWKSSNKKLKAYISFITLDKLVASGASDVYVDGVISGDNLAIELSGASDFKGAVRVNELTLEQSGASDVLITGSVARLTTIRAGGASDVKGYDLVTENCSAHATGASDIHITVNKELNVHASGASSIYYKGSAVIRELHTSGASNVSKKS